MPTKSEIALVRSLASKKERDASGLFVAEGEKLVGEILASDFAVRKIFTREGIRLNGISGRDAEKVSAKEMERLSLLKTPSRILALVETPLPRLPEHPGERALALALDDVQDPGNLGTIIRLADWFGIRDILCSEATADCFNPKVVQATMGAILRVSVHYLPLADALAEAAGRNVPVYGTFLAGHDFYGAELSPYGSLTMGNEGKGIGPDVARHVTRRLYLPPYPAAAPGSESLNVAVATAVACAEFRRRLR